LAGYINNGSFDETSITGDSGASGAILGGGKVISSGLLV